MNETKDPAAYVREHVLVVDMPDGEWEIPLANIAASHAAYYAGIDGSDYETAFAETCALFAQDDFEAQDWALGSMNWDELGAIQVAIKEIDYQAEWMDASLSVRRAKK